MSNLMRQIARIKQQLNTGMFERNTITGGTEIRDLKYCYRVIRSKEPIKLTPGRRRMLEAQLKRLELNFNYLFISAEMVPIRNGKNEILGYKKQPVNGTYKLSKHGPLKAKR